MYRNPELEEIKMLLHASGVKYRVAGKYLQLKCPYHDDRNPSAVIYKDNGYFKCFSCATERSFPHFYKDLTNAEWDGKLSLSLTMFNPQHDVAIKVLQNRQKNKSQSLSQDTLVDIDGELLPVCDVPKAKEYCDSRSIEDSFIDVFEFKALVNGRVNGVPWSERLVIPYKDEGLVKAVEGRDYTREQSKKVLYPIDTSVDFIFNRDNLNMNETLIVVEGVMDVHKIWQWVTANVTCTFGINMRERQKEMLKEFDDIILFIDDDEAGRKPIKAFEEFYPGDFRVAVIPGKDPGDGTRQELIQAIGNSRPFNEFLIDDVGLFSKKSNPSLSLSGS